MDYPIKTKFYAHSDKESGYDQANTLGLSDHQARNFAYTGYEIEFDIEVDEEGVAYATHVNGVALERKVQI